MKSVRLNLGHICLNLDLPDTADILSMGVCEPIGNPEDRIRDALANPVAGLPLKKLVQKKLECFPQARAVVVLSDNTRPVPYKGKKGLLLPLLETLQAAGLPSSRIRFLVATGTHRQLTERELQKMLGPEILAFGADILQHDSRDSSRMVRLGRTEMGGDIFINRIYMESEIKILTGLVESHFMAGVSGGRKSICPGLLSEASTHVLHGGAILSSALARDLVLKHNPVHEEATRTAKMAGCDMILNVTLDSDYRMTGVFAGPMEETLLRAYDKIKSYAAIPVDKTYDIILTHAGFVGVNHYQSAKGATLCAPIIQEGGICLLAAHHTDRDPIGGENYKRMMKYLTRVGTETFCREISEPSWVFVPEQWEAQMWTRLYKKTNPQNLLYITLDIPRESFAWLPEKDARELFPEATNLEELAAKSLEWAIQTKHTQMGRRPQVAVLADGPYGVPLPKS